MVDSKLAQLIGRREGWGIPGAIPTVNNNPGDLRHSPHSTHPGDPNAIGVIDSPEDGWQDLERQLSLWAGRGLTLAQAIDLQAPPSDGNDTAEYLEFICQGLGCPPDTLVSEALKIQ